MAIFPMYRSVFDAKWRPESSLVLFLIKRHRSHKWTLTCVSIFNRKCVMGYLWKKLLIMKESKQQAQPQVARQLFGSFWDFGQLLRFLAVFKILGKFWLKLFFTFFATFISYRKKGHLKSTGLYYWVSVWTPGLAQLPMPCSLVLHACPLGKRYHMIRFTKWRTTMSSWEARADEGAINSTVEFEFY